MGKALWLEIILNETGAEHVPVLFECDTHDEMNAFLEEQRQKLEKRFKMPVAMSNFNSRFVFTGETKRERGRSITRTFLVLCLHGEVGHQSNPKTQLGTREENYIQPLIAELVAYLQENGQSHMIIPSIFANAAYQELIDNGSIRLNEEIYTR